MRISEQVMPGKPTQFEGHEIRIDKVVETYNSRGYVASRIRWHGFVDGKLEYSGLAVHAPKFYAVSYCQTVIWNRIHATSGKSHAKQLD